jgi:hypothetical protein
MVETYEMTRHGARKPKRDQMLALALVTLAALMVMTCVMCCERARADINERRAEAWKSLYREAIK